MVEQIPSVVLDGVIEEGDVLHTAPLDVDGLEGLEAVVVEVDDLERGELLERDRDVFEPIVGEIQFDEIDAPSDGLELRLLNFCACEDE